jgi:hypothetical protein
LLETSVSVQKVRIPRRRETPRSAQWLETDGLTQRVVLGARSSVLARLWEPDALAYIQRTTAINLPQGNDRTSKSIFVQKLCIAAPIRIAPNSINCFIAVSPDRRAPSIPVTR